MGITFSEQCLVVGMLDKCFSMLQKYFLVAAEEAYPKCWWIIRIAQQFHVWSIHKNTVTTKTVQLCQSWHWMYWLIELAPFITVLRKSLKTLWIENNYLSWTSQKVFSKTFQRIRALSCYPSVSEAFSAKWGLQHISWDSNIAKHSLNCNDKIWTWTSILP